MKTTAQENQQLPLIGIPAPELPPFATDNPREVRIIVAMAARSSRTREELDRIAGASNTPDAIAALRNKGLELPCHRQPVTDQDGRIVYRGEYSFTAADRERTRHVWSGSA